jgi:hypothetical protein
LISNQFKNEVDDDITESAYYQKIASWRFHCPLECTQLLEQQRFFEWRILENDEWTGEDGLLFALLKEVGNAVENPKEAYLSGKCLLIILKSSADARMKACQMEASRIVSQASSSWDSYLLLKTVALELLSLLEDSK